MDVTYSVSDRKSAWLDFRSLKDAIKIARALKRNVEIYSDDTFYNRYEKFQDPNYKPVGYEIFKIVNGVETFYTAENAPDYEDIIRLSNGAEIELFW